MRRSHALVALLCVVTMSSAAPGAHGAAASGPRVTVFGDSVAGSLAYVPEARQLLGAGLDLRLELAPCRRLVAIGCPYMGTRPPSVLDVVRSSAADLGRIVVVDVGYNEPSVNYATDMATLVQALVARGVDHVIWVTMREKTDNYREIDAAITSQARRWPQVEVADWDAASRGKPWFQADGLHLNGDGAVGLAVFLRPLVVADCGAPCQPTPAPRANAPRNVRLPSIQGAPLVGRTLTCRLGSWQGATPMTFQYGWVRGGHVIAGASGRTWRLVAADRGRRVACRVWASNTVGSGRATSRAVLVHVAP